MREKVTLENFSLEMDSLWDRIRELEHSFSRKLETTLRHTTRKLRHERHEPDRNGGTAAVISHERRRRLIELTAYRKAERRGFIGGDPEQDWLEAEREIDQLLLSGQPFLEDRDVVPGMPPRQQ